MPICHLTDRTILRLSGPDTRPFLQGLLTQDVEALSPDAPLYAGLLSPQGKALFSLFLFADGADVLVDAAADQAEALVKRLTMFRLRKQVSITPEPAFAVWQAWGADAGIPRDPRTPLAGSRHTGPADAMPPATEALDAWHAHRLAQALPDADEIGSDELLWLETGARELNGVSFTKGCYTGQENTARMHHRDKLRKRLLPIRLSGASTPDARVMASDRPAGELRGARHGNCQMALFRMEYLRQPLTVDGAPAEVVLPAWLAEEPQDG